MPSSRFIIKGAKIYTEKAILSHGYIFVENGVFTEIGEGSPAELPSGVQVIEAEPGSKIIPGFIDVHIHGAAGADTMDATQEALAAMASILPEEGTTSFLATTITQSVSQIDRAVRNVKQYRIQPAQPGRAEILGIHLEGPFINPSKKGAQPEQHILEPDIEQFKKWQEDSGNCIKLVTVAPEQPNGYEFIQYLAENGVVASMGHTDATYEQMEKAVLAGARQVTHLFNGMRGLHHREPGTAGAALLFKELKAEIIADGIHVRPEMIQLAVNSKGREGMILITDSMRAKCIKPGTYDLGGQEVKVENGQALLEDGTLAGSILKMADSVRNMIHFTTMNLEDVIHLASVNPAKQLGIFDRKGSIAPGKDADFVLVTSDLQILRTFCRGTLAYDSSSAVK
ncbi:N-acetylglucosamine-6-phosphate deacetylase [Peribacillus kribbensis]|uniref:N-acetylglucosamine-6-phosphate deacetylase n=1 Tax=Peribacillus kribbensis TaxID=356658 RepID=UPI00040DF3A6|nr:N-acetylglucosamine-6-phosphate deacetylase [Peribacillus kribbensis]